MKEISNIIFGKVEVADIADRLLLLNWIKNYPLDAFQILNKEILNPRGFGISIDILKVGEFGSSDDASKNRANFAEGVEIDDEKDSSENEVCRRGPC